MQLVEATERTGNQLKVSASPELIEIVRTAEFSAPLFLFVIVKTKKKSVEQNVRSVGCRDCLKYIPLLKSLQRSSSQCHKLLMTMEIFSPLNLHLKSCVLQKGFHNVEEHDAGCVAL